MMIKLPKQTLALPSPLPKLHVIYKAKRSKTHEDLEDVDDVDIGEVSIAGPSTETRGQDEDGGGEDDCQQDSGTDQEGHSGEDDASSQQSVFQWPPMAPNQHIFLDNPEGACIEDGTGMLLAVRQGPF